MNGKIATAFLLAAMAVSARAEVHTRTSFTITFGNHPRPEPRVVVVDREPPPARVVYVERPAPRCHRREVVYLAPRRGCGPAKVVVLGRHGRGHREAWVVRERGERFDRGDARFEGRDADRDDRGADDDRVADDEDTRSINR